MGALDQYITLYRDHRALIDENSAEPLNALRDEAARRLDAMSLPPRGSENFENIDLDRMLATDYGINLQKLNIDVNPEMTFRCEVPVTTKALMMMINDTFAAGAEAFDSLPDGVDVGSLREFGRIYPREVGEYYGKGADMDNPIVALNTMLAQDGLYLRVRRGVRLNEPLQLVNILSAAMPLMAVRRLLIVIEDDAEARLLVCDHTQRDDKDLMALETVEIFVGRNSRLDYYHIEESTERTSRLSALYMRQQQDSQVNIDGMTLFNGTTRNEYYCRFEGEGGGLRLYGMGIEDRDRVISTFTHIDHAVPRCKSDELFKFTVDDNANGAFTGRIHVAEGAVKTEAYQANRNLVGAGEAKMQSKPQLEIYNDDVKCSHGCAIGQLDPMQVFYMRTRGLSEQQATLLLRQAFMADVIAAVDLPQLRERLHLLTERRFAGLESACGTCAHCRRDNCRHGADNKETHND